MSNGANLFGNIADPISMTRFVSAHSGPAGFFGKLVSDISFSEKISDLLLFLVGPAVQLFTKITSLSVFISFSLGYLLYFRKTIPVKIIILGIFSLASFYLVSLINSIRYENAYHYVIFQEFFLLSFSLVLVHQIPKVKIKIIVLTILILTILLINLVPYTKYYNWLKRKGHHPFCTSGLIEYHKLMDIDKIRRECLESIKEN
jgi:hypothetical protein